MSARKIASLLSVALLLWACDQTGTAILAAAKNVITAPIDGVRKLGAVISGNTYEDYAKRTDALRYEVPGSCGDASIGKGDEFLKSLTGSMQAIRNSSCTCRPWGTCTPSNCGCGTLCPDSFDIFSVHADRNLGGKDHEFPFLNSFSDFANQGITQGYCWGHASMTAKFNRLAFFKPNSPAPKADGPAEREYYRAIIKRIRDNQATEIPGYSSLHDFSEDPAIQELIKDEIKEEWADKAMTLSGASIALKAGKMTPEAAAAVVADIKRRTTRYQSPQMVFTVKGKPGYTHALLVSEVRKDSAGNSLICLRDNNDEVWLRSRCQNYFLVKKSGEISAKYHYGEIGGVVIGGNENSDTVAQIHSLVAKCRGDKKCGS